MQQSQAKGGKHEGFEPDQTIRQLWKDTIQPRLNKEADDLLKAVKEVCKNQDPESLSTEPTSVSDCIAD